MLREPLHGTVLDDKGADISVNVYDVGIGFEIKDDFDPGTYYIKATVLRSDATYPVPYTIHAYEDTDYTEFIDGCEAATAALNNPQINDSLYGCQWHLHNQEQGGEDINVEAVWVEGINGAGVNVAVVDDGMYYAHEDLAPNVDTALNHNYDTGNRDSRDIYDRYEHHGTAVAGIIAAQDNGIGVRGVAPRATVYGYNYLAGDWQQFEDRNLADAMSRNRVVTAISNNSWGPVAGPWPSRATRFWESAIDSGIREGYEGKGVFYVFTGGNGGRGHLENPDGTLVGGYVDNVRGRGDNSNLNEFANYYAVTAVCAVNDGDVRSVYSEKGANLWICAPSNDLRDGYRGIVTTENSDRYVDDFGGTSAAAPIVSGVAALLRQANPDLSWRDLKLILAASARKNDAANSGWVEGARKYGAGSATDRYHFNHEYGFGMVDAEAAVDIARGWTNVPPLESVSVASEAEVAIPPPSGSIPQTVTTTLTLDTGIRFTEFVEVNTDFEHTSFRDMDIELVSPSGAVSKLTVPFNTRLYTATSRRPDGSTFDAPFFVRLDGEFRFGSARHLGEDPNGQWTLRLTDHFPELGGTLRSWSIKVYGHVSRSGAPTITTPITAGADSLTVAWSAPVDDGGPAITAYDLRYIQTSADETVDANWTLVEDVWMGSGPLNYIITGLTRGTQYDVQVRAVSADGDGPWSATATGTAGESDQEALVALYNATEGPNWANNTNWLSDKPLGEWHGVTTDANGRVTELNLGGNQLSGEIPFSLGSLANLQELNLWGNQLTGMLPDSLTRMTALTRFFFYNNPGLCAPVGDAFQEWLESIADGIGSSCAPVDSPEDRSVLVKLHEATGGAGWVNSATWLSDRPVREWYGVVNDASGRVTGLFLHRNQLTGEIPAELGNLTNLAHLRLDGNKLAGTIPAELGRLTNLTVLYLSGNPLTGCVPASLRDVEDTDFAQLGLTFCTSREDLSIAGDAAVSDYAEDQADTTVATYTVSGDNVATAMWSLPTGDPDGDGPLVADQTGDQEYFELEGTGQERVLKFKATPDFEMPRGQAVSATNTNVYMVTLQVRHDDEDIAFRPVTITVTDVDELGMLSGDDSFSYAEDGTDAVGTYTLTAIEDGPTVTWSLDGTDKSDFMLDGTGMSRMLKFSSAPNYEAPADADSDNTYMVTVKASAGGEMKMVDVTVMVTDVDELDELTSDMDSPISHPENSMDTVATYTVTGTMADMATWTLGGDDAESFMLEGTGMSRMLKFSSAPDYEAPADADSDNTYMVTVKASAGGEMKMVDVTVMVTDVDENVAPAFPSETATRSIAENTAANTNIGDPVAATDPNGDTLTYSLEGTDAASFGIDGSTGQLSTLAALDFETKTAYTVVVKATDPGGLSDTIDVTINVTDVDEEVPVDLVDGYDTNGVAGIQIDELFECDRRLLRRRDQHN